LSTAQQKDNIEEALGANRRSITAKHSRTLWTRGNTCV